ncbi:MAG: acyltransferase [Actinomycetota bacterium]
MAWKNLLPSFDGRDLLTAVVAHPLMPVPARWRLLRAAGAGVSPALILAGVRLPGRNLRIGRGAFINRGVTWDGHGSLRLGERCAIGHEVLFIGGTHEIGGGEDRAGKRIDLPISVGDGTWIGARATVLPGVSIGAGCIIAAGAVVSRDCEPHGVYAGVPARRIRDLD